MTKIKKEIGEETISQIFKRGRKASRYYINSVWRSGELVKGFRAKLSSLSDGKLWCPILDSCL